jgi:hypothetical protein
MEATMTDNTMLPCPFCGGKAIYHIDHVAHCDSVYCETCNAAVSDFELAGPQGSCKELWNTRHDIHEALLERAVKLALERAAGICTGDEGRPDLLPTSKLRRMSAQEQFAHEQIRLAWKDADEICALSPTAIIAEAKGETNG